MHSAIRTESIKLAKVKDDEYFFTFNFDANFDCSITMYFCCQELRNANNIPLHFVTSPDLPNQTVCQYRFSKGLNQEFPP